MDDRVTKALDIAKGYGAIDGAHHKMWVIDQMVRALTGCPDVPWVNMTAVGGPLEVTIQGTNMAYLAWVASHNAGEDGPATYRWEEGVAP